MKDQPNDQHPATDDQELAKVLAGNGDDAATQTENTDATTTSGLQFEETPLTDNNQLPAAETQSPIADAPALDPLANYSPEMPADEAAAEPTSSVTDNPAQYQAPAEEVAVPEITFTDTAPVASSASAAVSPELESIKKDALEELRPLVSKLDLPAEEKFDTMLLIIRTTDDQSLLGAAHNAAKEIQDEKRRAEALLDVIKEIDYFGNQHAA